MQFGYLLLSALQVVAVLPHERVIMIWPGVSAHLALFTQPQLFSLHCYKFTKFASLLSKVYKIIDKWIVANKQEPEQAW